MFKWLRRRREAARRAAENANRLRKRSDQAELPSDLDALEELARILGESDASEGPRVTSRIADRRPGDRRRRGRGTLVLGGAKRFLR